MLFLCSFSYKLCLILFRHTAIMYQYRWTLWGTRGDIVMIHIVPISPPLFFRPPKFIVWVVIWYFDFCHLRVKIKDRFRTDISEITLKRTDKSYSLLYSLSPDYIIGRSCRTDPAPFRFSPNTCLLKALCRCKDLNLASSYACLTNLAHLIPSDVCHQRQTGIFAALKSPPKNLATHFLIG